MDRDRRFMLWCVAVGAALASGLASVPVLIAPAAILRCLALTAILWLLVTTPADAIRLRPWTSVVCITAGTLWLAGWRWGHEAAAAVAIGGGVMMSIAVVARGGRSSVWWYVPVLWHPAWGMVVMLWSVSQREARGAPPFPLWTVLMLVVVPLVPAAVSAHLGWRAWHLGDAERGRERSWRRWALLVMWSCWLGSALSVVAWV